MKKKNTDGLQQELYGLPFPGSEPVYFCPSNQEAI